MSSVIRETVITGGLAILTSALADIGDDVAEVIVERIFTAADIGGGPGQTRDVTNPTVGCLAAQFSGSRIVDVEISGLYRYGAGADALFAFKLLGTGANTSSIAFKVVYNKNLNISSIYIVDRAAANPGAIVAADYLMLRVRLGSSVSPLLPPLG